MNDYEEHKRNIRKRNIKIWLAIGVVVLIILLMFWVDIADIMGAGDGAA